MRQIWYAYEVAILKRMAAAGKTYSEVGQALGRTRGSIAGKASKLGIEFNADFWAQHQPVKPEDLDELDG